MALYAFDGTWNEAKSGDDTAYKNTNVFRFYEAYHAASGRNDFYVPGVGTRFDALGHAFGGAFGLGELPRIKEAFTRLCENWAAGDHVIDVVGFSRGAATTLDFCHHVLESGIRKPGTDEIVEPQPQIRFLGVWDVVGAFGLANLGNTALNIGHHLELPRANLQYCFHALALDERRPSFLPTRLPGAEEVWFRGVHSDIGGGNGNRGLNDITLRWMFSKAKAAGLPIADAAIQVLLPDPTAEPHPARKLPFPTRFISPVDRRHHTVAPLADWANPPATCPVETPTDEQIAKELGASGIEVLPLEQRIRILAMWDQAEAVAKANGYNLDLLHDALLTLFQSRLPLITNDAQLTEARKATVVLLNAMIRSAKNRGFHTLPAFFLTEALFQLPHTFPLTD